MLTEIDPYLQFVWRSTMHHGSGLCARAAPGVWEDRLPVIPLSSDIPGARLLFGRSNIRNSN